MLGNLLSPSPEQLAAQKEQRLADRNARTEELDRLRGLLNNYTTESKVAGYIPEDVEWIKTFLKKRISEVQTQTTITEDKLLALQNNKESQNFENLKSSLVARGRLFDNMKRVQSQYKETKTELEKAKKPVPEEIKYVLKVAPEVQTWLLKNMFLTPDDYNSKEQEINEEYNKKFKGTTLGEVEKTVQQAEKDRCAKRDEFSITGLINDVLKYIGGYFGLFLIFVSMTLGSSLAVNLNIYKNWAFRLLYAVYGAIFCAIVIPYVLGYRWLFLGKKPKFYSLIPLFPYHWDSRIMQILLGWISYRPDEDIYNLLEWEKSPQ